MAVEPVDGQTTESVTHGSCNTRPTVIFAAAEHHRLLPGTKLICLVNGSKCVRTTCPRLLPGNALSKSQTSNLTVISLIRYCYSTKPHCIAKWLMTKTTSETVHSILLNRRFALGMRAWAYIPLDEPWYSTQQAAATATGWLDTAAASQAGSQKPAEADHSVTALYRDCTGSHNVDWYQCYVVLSLTADLSSAELNTRCQ